MALAILILLHASTVWARIEVEAIAGKPFGVARVTIPRRELREPLNENVVQIRDAAQRVYYPAFRFARVGPIIGELIGIGDGSPESVTLSFLFTGNEPFRVSIATPESFVLDVVPRVEPTPRNEREYRRSLERWWKDYHSMFRDQRQEGDYPPLAQTYLLATLAQRLQLESPQINRDALASDNVQEVLELLAGTEKLREAVAIQSLSGQAAEPLAQLPVPAELAWPELTPPFDPAAVIDPIARRVPHECFYIRFGRFSNFLWLNKLLEEYGGDMGRLVMTRGFQQPLSQRLQDQLVLKQDALAELLGETVIADVALIGRDYFLQEGAAMGVLFQAKNSALLANDFQGKRQAAFNREKANGATLETVRIAGREVSFLSTPDNRLRSFYAQDGDFHLITTSRNMVERFFATAKDGSSLGESAEFRYARTMQPLKADETVFIYASTAFLRGLVSPRYQVELRRRLQSTVDMQNLQLARLVAKHEGLPGTTIDQLIASGLLPRGFGRRPDGSGIIVSDQGELDSLRGARGTFIPIPDVALQHVTPAESARCEAQAAYYQTNWKQMDPLLASIRRFKLNETGLERIVMDAFVAPFEETKYGAVASMLGPPNPRRITGAPGDVIQIQAFLKGGLLDPAVGPHHLFLGVQDHVPLDDLKPTNLLKTLQLLKTTPGYLGAWPKTGFIDRLPLGLSGSPPDAWGYSRLIFGLWRRQGDGFSVLSFDPQLLAQVTPHLAVEEAPDTAQVRVRVGNLAETKISGLVNTLYFEQARRTSQGNARFMQMLDQQYHVPLADTKPVVERLLDAKLVCSLGGEYKIQRWPSGVEAWVSDAWPENSNYRLPAEYQSPLLVWFRGLNAGLTKLPDQLKLHVELDMQRTPRTEVKMEIPLLNWFSAPKAEEKPKPEKAPAEELPGPIKLFPKNPSPAELPKGNGRDF
jgi:hypothetical protein